MDRLAARGDGMSIDAADTRQRWADAGLYDPASAHATERLALLEWVAGFGASIEQMVAADSIGQLGALPGDLLLRPGPHRSLAEMSRLLGIALPDLVATRRASGLPPVPPDEPLLAADDERMFRAFDRARQFFSPDEVLHFTRVLGSSMRRVADAASEMFLADVEAEIAPDTPHRLLMLGHKIVEAMQLTPSIVDVFEPLFRAQLQESVRVAREARTGSTDYTTVPLAIGFVDLSGFTTLSEQAAPAELLRLVLDIEADAIDLVADHGGRVVKLIGDEVMFTCVDPRGGCEIALGLVRAMAASTATEPRGGLAYGPVIAHGGDLYGATVNRASRMVDLAVPREVLVDSGVVEHTAAGASTPVAMELAFEPAGRRMLKGVRDPVPLWSLSL